MISLAYLRDSRGHVGGHRADGRQKLLGELREVHIVPAQAREEVLPRRLGHADGAGDGRGCLLGGGPCDALCLLHAGDGLHHVGVGVDGEVGALAHHAGELVGVRDEALHLGLSSAVAQLQVVEHGVVLLGEALEGVLHVPHAGAEHVHVVAHGRHGEVGVVGRLGRVARAGGDERRGEARGLLHVLVRAHAAGPVRLRRVCLQLARRAAEELVNAAHELLVVGVAGESRARHRRDGRHHRSRASACGLRGRGERAGHVACGLGDSLLQLARGLATSLPQGRCHGREGSLGGRCDGGKDGAHGGCHGLQGRDYVR